MERNLTPHEALNAAIAAAGGQTALAEICGVTQPAVWKWVQSSKRLPGRHAIPVEAATGISRHDLAPEFYPVETPPRFHGVDVRANRANFNNASVLKDAAA